MSKLTKAQAELHAEACERLQAETLSDDDRWFVLEHWQESARHVNSTAGAFFTPWELARDFAIEVHGHSVIDLCAGIGALSFMVLQKHLWSRDPPRLVCVEVNPDYVAVGRKLVPEATWICADVFRLPALGHFDCAISNPPFGIVPRSGSAPRFTGKHFEYHVVDVASDIADCGAFIIPQLSAPFRFSGSQRYEETAPDIYSRFVDQTGIRLETGCGIDTSLYRGGWRGVAPVVEVVLADFVEARAARAPAQHTLLLEAAE